MTIVRILLALVGLSLTCGAVAQERLHLGTSLDQLVDTMDTRCPVQAADLESRRSQLDASGFRNGPGASGRGLRVCFGESAESQGRRGEPGASP